MYDFVWSACTTEQLAISIPIHCHVDYVHFSNSGCWHVYQEKNALHCRCKERCTNYR